MKNFNQKTKKKWLIFWTVLSFILVLISFFWVPVVSSFGVQLPFIVAAMILPIVVLCSIPFAICVTLLINFNAKKKDK